MTQPEDIDTQSITLIAIFLGALFVVMIIGAQVLWYRFNKEDEFKKRGEVGSQELHDVQNEQRQQITTYRWVDKSKDLVAIPIERAMELELHTMQSANK